MYARRKPIENPPRPSQYQGKPIVASLLVDDEDIDYISSTNVSLSLKKSFFDIYEKGSYVDLLFIGQEDTSNKVYRYKMVSESDEAINLRLECVVA